MEVGVPGDGVGERELVVRRREVRRADCCALFSLGKGLVGWWGRGWVGMGRTREIGVGM